MTNNPIASSSTSSNKSVDESLQNGCVKMDGLSISSNYRPKSPTLISFIYIDEAIGGGLTPDPLLQGNISSDSGSGIVAPQEVCLNGSKRPADSSSNKCDNFRQVLKRCESLRLPNSIRGAIMLTKKAGATSGNQLARLSESLRDKFRSKKSRSEAKSKIRDNSYNIECDDDLDNSSETCIRIVNLLPGNDGKYGFKIHQISSSSSSSSSNNHTIKSNTSDNNGRHSLGLDWRKRRGNKSKGNPIIICDVSPNSPAATSNPRLHEGDQVISINGIPVEGLSGSKVETLIKNIQHQRPPNLTLEILSRRSAIFGSADSLVYQSDTNSRFSSNSETSTRRKIYQASTLAGSINDIKRGLQRNEDGKMELIEEFERLSRKKEDESLDESKLMENIDKNRYRDVLPYDSTRVQLIDSMTGDYINASFVDIPVPTGLLNRYIATQGPLPSTCDDFWQMVWEQSSSLIIMVTPLVEAGRVKCHKYWPDEKHDERFGQILVRNINEKSKTATIDRTIQLIDIKSREKRTVTQIQYKAWPDHEIPADCSDFLKLISRVRKHRASRPSEPIVVHCSAGIGRTGVLILMETAICIMESCSPVYPIKILQDMRKQRAMLIQTNSQFLFVADAICKVYDQKLYKKSKKHRKK